MALISIKVLTDWAKAQGFRCYNHSRGAELFAPDHSGPDAMWSSDSQYSCADFVLSDRPVGYGYNACFYGPWHDGMVQTCDAARLLAHPAMIDFDRRGLQ